MNPRQIASRLFAIVCGALALPAFAQIPANGSFEAGNPITNWTIGGDNRAGAVRDADVTGTLVIPDGTYVAAISTGPGARSTGPLDFDGFGGNNDYDQSWLETTMTFNFSPAFIAFDWAFASSEQNEPDQYDDVMDVKSNGTRIFSRSSCKLNGSSYSPFPNSNCQNATQVNNTINAPAALDDVNLRFGPPGFQRTCIQLPNIVAGNNTVTLRFSVADSNDRNVDSTLFVDNVQLKTSCNEVGSITQLTNTSGANVEIKGGGFIFTPAAARLVANDATGTNVAFATSANVSANPSLLDQVYVWNGTTFTRAAALTLQRGGAIQGLSMSAQSETVSGTPWLGRYIAISANLTEADNAEIYRYDRATNTLAQITTTSGCQNTGPTISGDGGVIAFESTCAALTNAGTQRKIVIWNGTTIDRPFGTATGCDMSSPNLTKNANDRYLVFASSCVHSGTNNDGNVEIYRFDRTNSAYVRITNTAASVTNAAPILDGSTTGQYVYFISNGNLTPSAPIFNADLSYEIFRQDVTGTTTTQRTNSSDDDYIGLDVSLNGNLDYAYERISRLNGLTSVGKRRVNTTAGAPDPEENLATGISVLGARLGLSGVVPIVNFLSSANFLNTNADGNTEVWQGRVQ